jgi:hypothetical protein
MSFQIRSALPSLLLAFLMLVFCPLAAQTEAESGASDGLLQSNSNERTQEVLIGTKLRYQKSLRHKPSDLVTFKGVIDSSFIAGSDTIPIASVGYISVESASKRKLGRTLLILGIVAGLLVLPLLFTSLILGLSGAWVLYYIAMSFTIISLVSFLPLIIIGAVFLGSGRRWFEIKSQWRLTASGQKAGAGTGGK